MTLARLVEHADSRLVRFVRGAFVVDGRRRQGLTRRIGGALRVPLHRRATCAACQRGVVHRRRASSRSAREHGVRVDRELVAYAEGCGATNAFDATTRSIIDYVERVRGWRVARAQVPIYVRALDVATAIDLVCVDRDERVHLVEVKATRADSGMTHACYEAPAPSVLARGALRGLERTRYAAHQLQAWAMRRALLDMDVDVASTSVVRADAHVVAAYPLSEWFIERDDALRAFLGRRRRASAKRHARRHSEPRR